MFQPLTPARRGGHLNRGRNSSTRPTQLIERERNFESPKIVESSTSSLLDGEELGVEEGEGEVERDEIGERDDGAGGKGEDGTEQVDRHGALLLSRELRTHGGGLI